MSCDEHGSPGETLGDKIKQPMAFRLGCLYFSVPPASVSGALKFNSALMRAGHFGVAIPVRGLRRYTMAFWGSSAGRLKSPVKRKRTRKKGNYVLYFCIYFSTIIISKWITHKKITFMQRIRANRLWIMVWITLCTNCAWGFSVYALDLTNVTVKTVLNNSVPKVIAQNVKLPTLSPTSVTGLPTMDAFCHGYTENFVEEIHITNFDFVVHQDGQGSDIGYDLVCHYQNPANLPQIEPSDTTRNYWNFNTQFTLILAGLAIFFLTVLLIVVMFK